MTSDEMERQTFADENGMTIDFVNWFFDGPKKGCGNVWFMMAAAMWEGWQARAGQEGNDDNA